MASLNKFDFSCLLGYGGGKLEFFHNSLFFLIFNFTVQNSQMDGSTLWEPSWIQIQEVKNRRKYVKKGRKLEEKSSNILKIRVYFHKSNAV